MKTIKFLILAITAITISSIFCACDNDDELTPIKLKDYDDTTIKIIYQNDLNVGYIIEGGDGKYSVTSDNTEIVTAEIINTKMLGTDINLRLEVKGLGSTKITITDKSQNSLILDISIDYEKLSYTVVAHDILISGDELTENEKKAISEEYLSEMPVKVGGGYTFIFTDINKGEALIYTDKFGDNAIETTFEKKRIDSNTLVYEIIIDNVKRSFRLSQSYYTPPQRMTMPPELSFFEDITTKVKEKYPKVERARTEQVLW